MLLMRVPNAVNQITQLFKLIGIMYGLQKFWSA